MRILLDQGTPFRAAELLRQTERDAVHTREVGLSQAGDSAILDFAFAGNRIVVTLDADFHRLLAVTGATKPSVVRIRIEGLAGEPFAALLLREFPSRAAALDSGCVISITASGVRLRRLPLPLVSGE